MVLVTGHTGHKEYVSRRMQMIDNWRVLLMTVCFLGVTTVCVAESTSSQLKCMTFNIRYGTAADGENAWPKRKELVMKVVQEFQPDVLGLQEALRFQISQFAESFPEYVALGTGRNADGSGEYSPVLFRRERFDVHSSGVFWLSDSPDLPGSQSWGNHIPRICTWVRFFDRQTGRRFTVYNTHWDHQSQPAREKSGQLIAHQVMKLQKENEPVILMGDFNAGEQNSAFLTLLDAGLKDTFRSLYPKKEEVGTFNGFAGRTSGEKIDAILVSAHWTTQEASIVRSNQQGRYPSDHFPVTATLNFQESE